MLSVLEVYAVERGDRLTSLDTHLFNECKKFDISFEGPFFHSLAIVT